MATSRKNGRLGTIDPKTHALAMSAKLFLLLTFGWKIWAKMAPDCLKLAKLRLQGGLWRGVSPYDKLLAPSWTTLLLRGMSKEILSKCKKVVGALKWVRR